MNKLVAKLRKKHTKTSAFKCKSRTIYNTWLESGVQSFCITPIAITKQEAERFRTQLAVALAKIVKENK